MKLCTTTEDFKAYYTSDIEKLRELAAAGFRYADLSMYNNEAAAYMHDNWKEPMKKPFMKQENTCFPLTAC